MTSIKSEPAYTEEDRRRVAAGEATIADIAGEKGVSRQAAHAAFKRKGWPTRPMAAPLAPEPDAASTKGDEAPHTFMPAEPSASPIMPVGVYWGDPEELGEIARLEATNLSLLVLDKARGLLAGPRLLSPQGLKATVSAIDTALTRLQRLGVIVDADAAQEPAQLVIREYSPEEIDAIRQQAEAEYVGLYGGDEDHGSGDAIDDRPTEPLEAVQNTGQMSPAAEKLSTPASSPGRFQPPSAPDLKALAERLARVGDKHGAAMLRSWCVAHGLETARAAERLIEILLEAARADYALAGDLGGRLTRLGI